MGGSVNFSVTASGSPPPGYQWRFNGENITGATETSLSLFNVQFSQAGGYSVVVSNASGSVTSEVATLTVTPPPVPVQVVSVAGLAGGQAQVPVALVATGNENALGFSLNFDTNLLEFLEVNLGSSVPAGASLLLNSTQAESGRVGVAVALAPGTTFGAGTQQVALVRFGVAPVGSPVTIPVTFGDQPTIRQLADSQARALPATWEAGAVNVSASVVRVVNTTAVSDGEVSLRVQLVAQGHENAVGFSLNFDSTVLGLLEVSPGANVPVNGTLIVNDTASGTGRVGVAVALAAESAFGPGTQEVAVIRFAVAPVLSGRTVPLNFGDQPTARQLSDGQARPLPSSFVDGSVTIVEVQYEGDVAPRPDGDRAVTIIDFVQLGRFVAALDTISGPAEYQRVDCAPRATRGNGAVTVSDLVQAGRYTVGLDPLTPVAGPESDAGGGGGGGGFLPASVPVVCVVNTSIAQGQTNDVPVTLEACGQENALSFSLTFDPAKLGYLGVLNGSGALNASLTINSNQVGSGRIGIVLALSPGQTISAGTRELVRVRMRALSTEPSTSEMAFANQPVFRETSDVTAGTIPTTYTSGMVSVTPPPGPPLNMSRVGNSIYITWPTTPPGFQLESSGNVAGSTWSPVSGVVDLGVQKLAVVNIEGDRRIFRLKLP